MENFKIEDFKKEYGYDFPTFYHLSEKECTDIKERWSKKFNSNNNGLEILCKIRKLQKK